MPLTADEIQLFRRDGMFVRRRLAPAELVGKAAALIERWQQDEMNHGQITEYTQRTFAPEHCSHPDLLNLYNQTEAAALATELLSTPAPVSTAQVQTRIPTSQLRTTQPEKSMHVDGVSCPHLDPAELRTFSLLVGVALSSIGTPNGGALRYQPGGHHDMAEWFRTTWSLGITDQVPAHIAATEGIPLLAEPGDVLFMHHLVPHAVGNNHTNTPRVMAYFRISHQDHAARRLDALRDPWLDYPALREDPSCA